jgi:CRP-like cAMP-binding protein
MKHLAQGDYLFKQGEQADNAYLILFGRMNMVSREVENIDTKKVLAQ